MLDEIECPRFLVACVSLICLAACEPTVAPDMRYSITGRVQSPALDEISGLQASHDHPGVLWVHNDDGPARLQALDEAGAHLGYLDLAGARNRDWEDLTLVPRPGSDLLVVGDIGDNGARHERITLYLVEEPAPGPDGTFAATHPPLRSLELRYPDGARDAEAIAFDVISDRLLILSKRDRPPRLYGLSLDAALGAAEPRLEALGVVNALRPGDDADRRRFGHDAGDFAQPTGMDIDTDGARAAIISYRSLFLFDLQRAADGLPVFSEPLEILGPPSRSEEAVSYAAGGHSVYVTAEGLRAPIFRFDFLAEEAASQQSPARGD